MARRKRDKDELAAIHAKNGGWRKHSGKLVDKGVYGVRPDNYDPWSGNKILRSRTVSPRHAKGQVLIEEQALGGRFNASPTGLEEFASIHYPDELFDVAYSSLDVNKGDVEKTLTGLETDVDLRLKLDLNTRMMKSALHDAVILRQLRENKVTMPFWGNSFSQPSDSIIREPVTENGRVVGYNLFKNDGGMFGAKTKVGYEEAEPTAVPVMDTTPRFPPLVEPTPAAEPETTEASEYLKKMGVSPRKIEEKRVWEMSGAEKAEELFGKERGAEFKKDLNALIDDDEVTMTCMNRVFGGSDEDVKSKVYPKLAKFKEKWGIDMPIGMTGVNVVQLDQRLECALEDKRNGVGQHSKDWKAVKDEDSVIVFKNSLGERIIADKEGGDWAVYREDKEGNLVGNVHGSDNKGSALCQVEDLMRTKERPRRKSVEPDEEDYVIAPSGRLGSKTSVGQSGKHLGEFDSESEAESFIKKHREKQQFWPNVWFRDDHGGMTLRTIRMPKTSKASPRQTMIGDGFVKVWLSANDTYDWAHKPGAAWPGSGLSGKRLWVEYDSNGLVDIAVDGRQSEAEHIDAHELNALVADSLRDKLPKTHPLYNVVVGQFD
jgi:hypothetical protein